MTRQRYLRALLSDLPVNDAQRTHRESMHQPVDADPSPPYVAPARTELFVWFEDNRRRQNNGARGPAGFPECLLPYGRGMRVMERHYAEGHVHLLAAVRIRCDERFGERVATIYTAALALGTIAWVGTGDQYRRAWLQMFPRRERITAARRDPRPG